MSQKTFFLTEDNFEDECSQKTHIEVDENGHVKCASLALLVVTLTSSAQNYLLNVFLLSYRSFTPGGGLELLNALQLRYYKQDLNDNITLTRLRTSYFHRNNNFDIFVSGF
jgi:hypothetical protein